MFYQKHKVMQTKFTELTDSQWQVIEKHLIKLLERPEKDPHQSEIPY